MMVLLIKSILLLYYCPYKHCAEAIPYYCPYKHRAEAIPYYCPYRAPDTYIIICPGCHHGSSLAYRALEEVEDFLAGAAPGGDVGDKSVVHG